MPIHLGTDKDGHFVQWGHQKKYYYIVGNNSSLKRAKKLAQKQASAIFASGYIGESKCSKFDLLYQSIIFESKIKKS